MKILKILAFLLPIYSYAQEKNCIINIKVSDPTEKIYLQIQNKEKVVITDSAWVDKGIGTFKEYIDKPSKARITLKVLSGLSQNDPLSYKTIYLVPGTINIDVKDPDSLFRSIVYGPKSSCTYDTELSRPVLGFKVEIANLQTAFWHAKKENKTDTVTLKAQLYSDIKKCFNVPQQFIKSNPDSPLSIIALQMLGRGSTIAELTGNDIVNLYNSLSENVKNSAEGLRYIDSIKSSSIP